MIRRLSARYGLLVFATACANTNPQILGGGRSSLDANCPVTAYSETDRKSSNLSVSSRANAEFVSFIVDGQRAIWNVPNAARLGIEYSRGPMPEFNPPIDRGNVQSVKALQPDEAKRLYNACPGVLVVLMLTKAGNWRPAIPAQAFIGSSGAQFVFPPDSATSFTYDVPQARTYEGTTEFMWEVRWDEPEDEHGNDPHALALITRRRLGGPRTGSLLALVSRDSLKVMTYCTYCEAVASIPETDPNVSTEVRNGRLIFSLRGSDAVRRIFRVIPDSVTFFRAHHDPNSEEVFKVRVVRRNP
jgi:hypothetical protein